MTTKRLTAEDSRQKPSCPRYSAKSNKQEEKIKNNSVDPQMTAQMAGYVDPKNVDQADHEITTDERKFALEIAHEIATHAGINLQEYVNGQNEDEEKYAREMGFKKGEGTK